MATVPVISKSDKSYNIYIESDFSALSGLIEERFSSSKKVCIVSDENVSKNYLNELENLLSPIYEIKTFIIEAGEKSKNMDKALELAAFLFDNDFSRKDFVISLGGGVVSDLTGFASSVYKRGIPFINIPTTLLAMADASIGGKTGVDYRGVKNIIGAFNMPCFVYMPLKTLQTLPDREYFAGFAEVMKAGLGFDAKFYMWLIENMYEICDKDEETVLNMLTTAVGIKKSVVEKDPFENGDRALLNLGHTVGHALEAYFKGEYLHGECVAMGCVAAAFISWKKDMISMDEYYEIRDMFVPFNLPISFVSNDYQAILDILRKDKKNTCKSVNMALLKRIGKAVMVSDISDELIVAALDELNFKEE